MPTTEVKGVTHRAERLRNREFIKICNKKTRASGWIEP